MDWEPFPWTLDFSVDLVCCLWVISTGLEEDEVHMNAGPHPWRGCLFVEIFTELRVYGVVIAIGWTTFSCRGKLSYHVHFASGKKLSLSPTKRD